MQLEKSDPKAASVWIMDEGIELSQSGENAQNSSNNVFDRMMFGLCGWHDSILRGAFSTSVVLASVAGVGPHIDHPQ